MSSRLKHIKNMISIIESIDELHFTENMIRNRRKRLLHLKRKTIDKSNDTFKGLDPDFQKYLDVNETGIQMSKSAVPVPEIVPEPVPMVQKPSSSRIGRNEQGECSFQSEIPKMPWFLKYSQVVSIDCEMVSMWSVLRGDKYVNIGDLSIFERNKYIKFENWMKLSRSEKSEIKFEQQLASVSIVGPNCQVMYSSLVKRKPYSFRVNKYTKNINGFQPWSLEKGEEYDKVRQEVLNILRGKLVITCGGTPDLIALDMLGEGLDTFDLQEHYFVYKETDWGQFNTEKVSLRRIYYYLFEEDCQEGVHKAERDAISTMKCFKEYCRRNSGNFSDRKDNLGYEYEEIPRFEEMVKRTKRSS